jgi:HPt (histidine-containing phosphotransfer) domain-containing protein
VGDLAMGMYEDRRAQLTVVFAQRLESDLHVLQTQMENLRSGLHSDECRDAVRHLAHRMAGSAQLFDFGRLTEPAQTLETQIDAGAGNAEVFAALSDLIAKIRAEIKMHDAPEVQGQSSSLEGA